MEGQLMKVIARGLGKNAKDALCRARKRYPHQQVTKVKLLQDDYRKNQGLRLYAIISEPGKGQETAA